MGSTRLASDVCGWVGFCVYMCLCVSEGGEWVCVCLTYISEWIHFHSRALWTPHGNMKFEDCPLVDGSNDSIIMQWVDAMICAHF